MLAVTAAGLVTSMGDRVTACAALRAGMTRAETLDLELPNPGEEEPSQVRGHRVRDVAGTEDYGRLLALVSLALEEALGDRRALLAEDATRVVVILPPHEDRAALEGITDLEEEFPGGGPERLLAEQLPILLDVDFPPGKVELVRGGHTAIAQALARAREPLERRQIKRVVIAAADSLVEDANVRGLLGQARLRTDTVADGFHPGEAGGAVVIEDVPRDKVRDTPPLLMIGPNVYRAGPPPPPEPADDDEDGGEEESAEEEDAAGPAPWHPAGTALREALRDLHAAYRQLGELGAIIDDFNGESPRATYFWNSVLPLATRDPAFRALADLPRWLTADGLGEVGAATGVVQLCVAAAAFARGYAPKPSLLLSSVSDRGDAALVVVSAPQVG